MMNLTAALAVTTLVSSVGAWLHGQAYGESKCELEHQVAMASAQQQAQQQYESAIAWGNQVSAQLAARQTEIRTMRNQHADYALSIDGTCPGRLRYLHDAAALGATLPDAARASLAAAQPLDAARIAGAIADNYARARECAAQLNALIAWHEGPQ